MSRQHFAMIARVLAEQRAKGTPAERWRVDETARALAAEFATINPRFDAQRFLAAARGEAA